MKKKILIAVVTVVIGLIFVMSAFAQEGEVRTTYKKRTVVDFSDVTIEGELTKPQGSYISTRRSSRFNKLIKIRENFIPEMDISVDNL